MTGVVIRHLRGMPEFETAVSFQEETWGKGFSERVPRSLMKVTQRLGGVVAGAFDPQGRMVGFVYGMTGVESGRLVHWSDILAVSPEVRNDGVGRRLKAFQREAVLRLGVTRMYWTFDPLESRNAHLNLGRLGAVAREYAPDMYGVSDSPLHRGLGTDRFVATWELDSPRVEARLAGEPGPSLEQIAHLPVAFPVAGGSESGELPRPVAPAADVLDRGQEAGGLRVPIPLEIQELRDRNPELAAEWRGATRAVLHSATQRGWEVRELVRASNLSYYVVVPD